MYPSFLFLLILSRATSALSSKSGSWHPFSALEPGQHKCIIKNTTDSFIMLTQSANYWRESNESYPRSELWTNYTLSGCDFISPHHTSANVVYFFFSWWQLWIQSSQSRNTPVPNHLLQRRRKAGRQNRHANLTGRGLEKRGIRNECHWCLFFF